MEEISEKGKEYTTVSIPMNLVRRVDSFLEKGGYQNRSDFVRDAIRKLLDELQVS